MKESLKLGALLTGIYIVIAVILGMTVEEMDMLYLFYYLIIGVPALLGYFLLVILYHKGKRIGFRIVLLILIVLAVGFYVNETFYEPYKSRQDVIRQQQGG